MLLRYIISFLDDQIRIINFENILVTFTNTQTCRVKPSRDVHLWANWIGEKHSHQLPLEKLIIIQ